MMSPLKFSSVSRRDIAILTVSRGNQARPDFVQVTPSALDSLPNFFGLLLASSQIPLDFVPMPQIVGDDRIDVGESKRGVSLHNGLRRRAILERPND